MAAKRGKTQARRSGGGKKGGSGGLAWLLAGLAIGGVAFGYLHFKDSLPWGKPASTLPTPDPDARARPSGEDNGLADVPAKPKPRYDFYDLLPEREVVIPDAELDAQARAEQAARVAAAAHRVAAAEDDARKAAAAINAGADAPATPAGKPPAASPADVATSTDAPGASPVAATPATPAATPAPAGSALSNAHGERFLIQAGAFRGTAEAEALKAKIAMTGELARVETAEINGTTVHRVRMGPYPDASALAAAKQALAAHGITAQAIKVK
jgi:cell division protein FtsN